MNKSIFVGIGIGVIVISLVSSTILVTEADAAQKKINQKKTKHVLGDPLKRQHITDNLSPLPNVDPLKRQHITDNLSPLPNGANVK